MGPSSPGCTQTLQAVHTQEHLYKLQNNTELVISGCSSAVTFFATLERQSCAYWRAVIYTKSQWYAQCCNNFSCQAYKQTSGSSTGKRVHAAERSQHFSWPGRK